MTKRIQKKQLRANTHQGMMLIEILIALVLAALTGCAILALIQITIIAQTTTRGPVSADMEARSEIDRICDKLRYAQAITVGSAKQVFTSTNSSDVTFYTDSAGSTLRLWLDTSVSPAALKQTTVISGSTTTTVVQSGVTSMTLTYYQQAQNTYNAASSGWTTTANANVPVSSEWPYIGAVAVSINTSFNGYSRKLISLVRLRNSPQP